jgi:hypothetical protein
MDSLNQLIERLQQLHLEQARILEALENIITEVPADDRNERERTPTTTITTTTLVAAIATAVPVLTPIMDNIESVATVAATAPVSAPTTKFHIGQRVYITNCITHVSLVRHATEADRTAKVTHFTASCIAIRTINGYHTHHTHRHPKNLRPL